MLTLVLGGARSGKSRYAQSLLEGRERVCYVATAVVGDDPEMISRVLRHRGERPSHFETVEAPLDLVGALGRIDPAVPVLLDCVTLWLSNLLDAERGPEREALLLGAIDALVDACREREVVAVSNEVGGGIVPENRVAREFRDLQGRANQLLASAASRVVLLTAGIPLTIKG